MCTVIGNSIEMADMCYSCKKPVFFAERKTSLGKQWHRECLRCKECDKVLNPGQHAEHKGLPYCHHPCYQLRFGSLQNFRKPVYAESRPNDVWKKPTSYRTLQKKHILENLRIYNQACVSTSDKVRYCEKDEGLVMELRLRVYWHVTRAIQLLDSDESRMGRHSVSNLPTAPPTTQSLQRTNSFSHRPNTRTLPMSFDRGQAREAADRTLSTGSEEDDVVMRPACQQVHYYRRSINGHCFDGARRESTELECHHHAPSQVTIAHDTKTTILITNDDTTNAVIQILLRKFKVVEHPDDFGIFMISKDGFERRLMPMEIPLLEKLTAGPTDSNAKFILKEKNANKHLSEGVHDLMAVSMDMLNQMIERLLREEEDERALIRQKYDSLRSRLLAYLTNKESVV